jgi:hypothetical protein
MHLIFNTEKVDYISGDAFQGRTLCVLFSVMCHLGGQLSTMERLQAPNAKVACQIDRKKLMIIFCACRFAIKTSVQ